MKQRFSWEAKVAQVQAVRNFPNFNFYGIRKFIFSFIKIRFRPCPEPSKPNACAPLCSILIVLPSISELISFFQFFFDKIIFENYNDEAPNFAVFSFLLLFPLTWVHVDSLSAVVKSPANFEIFRLGGTPHIQSPSNKLIMYSVSIELGTGIVHSIPPRFHTTTHIDKLAV